MARMSSSESGGDTGGAAAGALARGAGATVLDAGAADAGPALAAVPPPHPAVATNTAAPSRPTGPMGEAKQKRETGCALFMARTLARRDSARKALAFRVACPAGNGRYRQAPTNPASSPASPTS